MPSQEMRDAVQLLTRLVAAQARRQETGIGHADRSVSARVRDFISLDPPVFTGADPNEDPQVFIDRVQRTLRVMKATETESVELASYRLRDVAVNWYESWELSRGENAHPVVWQEFTEAFLHHYLPPELRRSKVDRFLTLRQGNMSVREYCLQFDSLSKYAPTIVSKIEDQIHRFMMGLEPYLINDCMSVSLHPDMDISRIQTYAQGVEERKQKQRVDREHGRDQNKRARSSGPSGEFRDGQRQQYLRYPSQPSASAPPQFGGKRSDCSTYSRPGQNFRASGSQYRGESN
ncbi:uncharacterized protein [Nicotiana sylvestris]|uniref:uncharacterized protein n=1 Tax=Nicotiana sylvestris TaxID=4096 RepID=UPI00388C692F